MNNAVIGYYVELRNTQTKVKTRHPGGSSSGNQMLRITLDGRCLLNRRRKARKSNPRDILIH